MFEIFEDTNNDGIYTESVDRLFDQMVENAENPGTYEYHGLRYGGWFVIEKTAPKLYRLDPNAYYIKIEKDGQTEVIKNCEDGFENVPEHGTLELSKTDVANGTPLPNAGFRIKDKDGNIVAEGRSDYDGKVKFEKLRIGEYTYQEFDAPAGYVIDETPYKFEIKEDGQIVKANMTNKSIPVTGDEAGRMNLMIAVIALIALLGVGAVAAVIVVRKRRV